LGVSGREHLLSSLHGLVVNLVELPYPGLDCGARRVARRRTTQGWAMGFYGDPEELDRLAGQIAAAATHVREQASQARNKAGSTQWQSISARTRDLPSRKNGFIIFSTPPITIKLRLRRSAFGSF